MILCRKSGKLMENTKDMAQPAVREGRLIQVIIRHPLAEILSLQAAII